MLDELLVTREVIAVIARRSARDITRYAQYNFDPLRLEVFDDTTVQILRSRLESWLNRNHRRGRNEELLIGRKAIAARAHKSPRRAFSASQRSANPLPVQVEKDGLVWSFVSAVDDWVRSETCPYHAHRLERMRVVARNRPPERRWQRPDGLPTIKDRFGGKRS